MDFEDSKSIARDVKKFFLQKKVQWIIVTILFLFVLFIGSYIRLQPILNENLIDKTTGDYTPLALDPYYFLRVSETLVQTGGDLPEFDEFRYSVLNVSWTSEILPQSTILIHKVFKLFDPGSTLNLAAVANPVVFFVLGIIVFFFLCFVLSKSKWVALVASALLSVIPPYLYRTLAGFSDHESIGMFGFFLSLLFFSLAMLKKKEKSHSLSKLIVLGILAGIFTKFAIVSWGGGAKFLFMIIPLAFISIWLTTRDKKSRSDYFLVYSLWFLGTLVSSLFVGLGILETMRGYMLNQTGILTLFSLCYASIDFFLSRRLFKLKIFREHKEISIGLLTILIGGIFYQVVSGNLISMISSLFERLINPFGTGRVGLTVAENKQPYLVDWISQIGNFIFYSFLAACAFFGYKFGYKIPGRKRKLAFFLSFAFFVFGILFSRISSSSILNGTNFLSKVSFIISFLFFAGVCIWIYRTSDWKIDSRWVMVIAWMVPMIIAVRSAVRVFFLIVPFVAFTIPLFINELLKFSKKTKDDFLKLLSYLVIGILIIGTILTAFSFYQQVSAQAKFQTPSYNSDWQKAMGWVRNSTPENSLFLHWWDYGYWVQTGGDRATVTDGGHFNGYWDHLIGRYVLTTPYPETAKSFMKTHNVTHLLIDPTDIGKYGAYSSIGNGDESNDRASQLVTFVSNPSEIQEIRNGTVRFYRGGVYVSEDILYNNSGENIFLPAGKAALAGIFIEERNGKKMQPQGIFVYNGKEQRIPIRFMYSEGNLIDFGEGINSTAYIYPSIISSSGRQGFDLTGALMYLPKKAKDSLVVKLYLMNDPLNEYPELELVHSESRYPLPFYYRGFQGPIKIWEVNTSEMKNILVRKEFLEENGRYGGLDKLQFIK